MQRVIYCLALATTLALADPPPSASSSPKAGIPQEVELRGRVVCLPEEMHRLHQADLPSQHLHLYGFKAADGKYFTLLRTKYSEALFADERLRSMDLLLKGRLFPNTQIFEPMALCSIREGKVYDLVYYCEICEIFAVAPGICECCQGPTELIEQLRRP